MILRGQKASKGADKSRVQGAGSEVTPRWEGQGREMCWNRLPGNHAARFLGARNCCDTADGGTVKVDPC